MVSLESYRWKSGDTPRLNHYCDVLEAQRKRISDSWELYDTQTLLRAILAGQERFAEAEPLLLTGYDGLVQREATILWGSQSVSEQAGERVIRLYQDWGKPEKAAEWRKKLQAAASINHH
jgi:hypothetical protein